MKVFISQMMAYKTPEEILAQRNKAKKFLEDLGHTVVDSYFGEDSEANLDKNVKNIPLYRLGQSLQIMAECDAVYFCSDWEKSRGCRIEYQAADDYGLQLLYECPF